MKSTQTEPAATFLSKKMILLFFSMFIFSLQAAGTNNFLIRQQSHLTRIKIKDPRVFMQTYAMWGDSKSDEIIVTKSALNTCTNSSVFSEWLKAVHFNELYSMDPNDVFAYATMYSCREITDKVIFKPEFVLFSLSSDGNKILNSFVSQISGTQWQGNTLIFQSPRYQVFRSVISASDGAGQGYQWLEASYYRQIKVGFSMREGFDESEKFSNLMSTLDPAEAVDAFLGEKVMDIDKKQELVKAAKTFQNISYFYAVESEYEAYPFSSRTLVDWYGELNQLFAISYDCDTNRQCTKTGNQ